jgi:hypothetical protein
VWPSSVQAQALRNGAQRHGLARLDAGDRLRIAQQRDAPGRRNLAQFNSSGVFGASSNLTWSGTVLATTGLTATGAILHNTTTNNQSYTTTGAGTITISSGTTGTS